MGKKRVIYRNWITELGFDPSSDKPDIFESPEISINEVGEQQSGESFNKHILDRQEKISRLKKAVKSALAKLTENEREFIILFYYMGQSYREIADKSGKNIYRLEAIHKRALKKLKKELKNFAADEYGIETENKINCVICSSSHRKKIDKIISGRNRSETWKPVIDEIKKKYKIIINSPQILIGHEKYH